MRVGDPVRKDDGLIRVVGARERIARSHALVCVSVASGWGLGMSGCVKRKYNIYCIKICERGWRRQRQSGVKLGRDICGTYLGGEGMLGFFGVTS